MPYINTETKQFNISEADIKAPFPLVGFPCPFVAPEPYAWYFPAPQPPADPLAQIVREVEPELTGKGHWEQRWEVIDLDPEQAEANRVAALKAKRDAMVCTPWAMCKALNRLALLETVESAIAASNDIDLKYGWARAQEFKRLDGFVLTMQAALSKSDEFMDELFSLAMTL